MKYCLISSHRWKEMVFPEGLPSILPSGLYQWVTAFDDGDMYMPMNPDEVNQYDIIHINLPTANIPYVKRFVDWADSTTKVVVNIDYSIDMWSKSYEHITILMQEADRADLVFHTESMGAEIISNYLKRDVAVIPHPVNVKDVKAKGIKKPPSHRPIVGVIGHRYDKNYTMPFFALHGLDVTSFLFGFHGEDRGRVGFLYDASFNHVGHEDYWSALARCDICIEAATTWSYGRSVVECAALGIPVIGGRNVEAMKIIFPENVTDPNDIPRQHRILEEMIDEKAYPVDRMAEAEAYSPDHCKRLMLEALGLDENTSDGFDQDVRSDIRRPLEEAEILSDSKG